jgi:hypothetical protein
MRKNVLQLLSSFTVFLLLPPMSWQGSINCAGDRCAEAVVAAVRSQLNSELPLQATLMPGLSDDLIDLETQGLSRPIKTKVSTFSFFLVSPRRYEINDDVVERESAEVDSQSEWLVAVDLRNDSRYFLEGSSNSLGEFNRLMTSVNLKVTNQEGALNVFDFYLEVVRGHQFRSRVIGDDLKLESVALDDFRLRFPTSERRRAFNAWWRELSNSNKKSIVPPTANPQKGGFTVRYFLYDKGIVYHRSLTVNPDATIVEGESTEAIR